MFCNTYVEFLLKILDGESVENIFANGALNENAISIANCDDDSVLDVAFIYENVFNIIVKNSTGFQFRDVILSIVF